jgi:hypothetical protein
MRGEQRRRNDGIELLQRQPGIPCCFRVPACSVADLRAAIPQPRGEIRTPVRQALFLRNCICAIDKLRCNGRVPLRRTVDWLPPENNAATDERGGYYPRNTI